MAAPAISFDTRLDTENTTTANIKKTSMTSTIKLLSIPVFFNFLFFSIT